MDNLGKAIYIACFALLFVFAASISIYLYGTLNAYLNDATSSTNISYRAESESHEDLSNFKRNITAAEIYITLYNMEQMHVNTLTLDTRTVTRDDVSGDTSNFREFKALLENEKDSLFTYSCSNNEVTYTSR